jgi:hypothetical protein
MIKLVAEVNRAFSAEWAGRLNTWGVAPRLGIDFAPLALNNLIASSTEMNRAFSALKAVVRGPGALPQASN